MIHVVAGVLIDSRDRVLIAQRPPGKTLAGQWEFPGGKLEAGETPRDALARELLEELGVCICDARPLIELRHDYAFGAVLLDVWMVDRFDGEPAGLDGQALRWCRRDELDGAGLLAADQPIIRLLAVPARAAADRAGRASRASRVGRAS